MSYVKGDFHENVVAKYRGGAIIRVERKRRTTMCSDWTD